MTPRPARALRAGLPAGSWLARGRGTDGVKILAMVAPSAWGEAASNTIRIGLAAGFVDVVGDHYGGGTGFGVDVEE